MAKFLLKFLQLLRRPVPSNRLVQQFHIPGGGMLRSVFPVSAVLKTKKIGVQPVGVDDSAGGSLHNGGKCDPVWIGFCDAGHGYVDGFFVCTGQHCPQPILHEELRGSSSHC